MASKININSDKRGNIPTTILTIGVVIVCCLALYTFYSSTSKVRSSFVGLGTVEQMNSQIEQNYFYNQTGAVVGGYGDINSIFEYAKENSIAGRTCDCGSNCQAYASYSTNSASKNGIPDPILLLSLMMQESGCVQEAYSGSSVGLMQVNLIHCGEYGLPANQADCKKILLENSQVNIEVGAEILKASYDAYNTGKVFQGCTNRNILYTGWEAALRGYNGWGCGRDASGNVFYAQDSYVEDVMSRYNQLRQVGGYADLIGKSGLQFTGNFPFIKIGDKFLFSAKYIGQ